MLFELFYFYSGRLDDDVSIVNFVRTKDYFLRTHVFCVLEHLLSLHIRVADVASKNQILVVLLYVPAYILSNVRFSTARTSMRAFCPLHATFLTKNSLALRTLLRVLDDVVADRTLQHVFELLLALFYKVFLHEPLLVN